MNLLCYVVPMDWDDVRYFLALARSDSIRGAASVLRVSHSTVARRLEALEQKLEVRLFDRTPDGYAITSAGARMVQSAERMEAELASMQRALQGGDDRLQGQVTVTCVESYLADVVIRCLAPFCRSHPKIQLTVESSYSAANLSKREADIALRAFRPGKQPPEHLLGRSVVGIHYASYVAKRHATELDPQLGGSEARWLAYGVPELDDFWREYSGHPDVPLWGGFLGTDLQQQAARAGLGIANLPCYVGDTDPQLQRLVGAEVRQWFELWILSHVDLRETARLRAARQALADALKAEAPLLNGQRPNSVQA